MYLLLGLNHWIFFVIVTELLWTPTYPKRKRSNNSKSEKIHKLLWTYAKDTSFEISTSVSVFKNSCSWSSTQLQHATFWRRCWLVLFTGKIFKKYSKFNPISPTASLIFIYIFFKFIFAVYCSSTSSNSTLCIWVVSYTKGRSTVLPWSRSSSPPKGRRKNRISCQTQSRHH